MNISMVGMFRYFQSMMNVGRPVFQLSISIRFVEAGDAE
jgi:hypothetical protein